MKKSKKTTKINIEPKIAEAEKKIEEVTGLNLNNVESKLQAFFNKNIPALPSKGIELLVKIAPYLAILSVFAGVPAVLALLQVGKYATIYRMAGVGLGWTYQLTNILLVIRLVLTALSIQGLFAKKLSAWKLMYYSAWISALSGLFSGGIISMLITGFISFYLLFQVKSSYK